MVDARVMEAACRRGERARVTTEMSWAQGVLRGLWVLRACGVMLWPARWRVLRENAAQAMVLIVLGWSYYGAFFIHAGTYEWRYFMPGFVVIVVGVAMMVRGLARKAAACQKAVA